MEWTTIISVAITGVLGFAGSFLMFRGQAAKEASVAADALRDDMMGWAKLLSEEMRILKTQHQTEIRKLAEQHNECLEREVKLRQELGTLKAQVNGIERKIGGE